MGWSGLDVLVDVVGYVRRMTDTIHERHGLESGTLNSHPE